jgi:hypothetical protein
MPLRNVNKLYRKLAENKNSKLDSLNPDQSLIKIQKNKYFCNFQHNDIAHYTTHMKSKFELKMIKQNQNRNINK